MQSNRFPLNRDKTDVLWCATTRHQYQLPKSPLSDDGTPPINLVQSLRDLVSSSVRTHVVTILHVVWTDRTYLTHSRSRSDLYYLDHSKFLDWLIDCRGRNSEVASTIRIDKYSRPITGRRGWLKWPLWPSWQSCMSHSLFNPLSHYLPSLHLVSSELSGWEMSSDKMTWHLMR